IIPKERYIARLSRYDDVRDKYDRHVLACAIEAKCDIIVSSDKGLLEYCTGSINIYNARTVLELL
ncbi:MAG: PIN domain-containing protein, partial [Candidatus Dadabacteria bacterium]|nr:PIN domain-containing protein [Candidatus Dadabacteria bacterium]